MEVMSFTVSDLQNHANVVLVTTLNSLVKEGYLTLSQADEITLNYSIVVENRSWLPKWLSDKMKLEKNKINYRLYRAIDREMDIKE